MPNIILITGPTASGKSGLALSVAQSMQKKNRNSVIVNADSQQIYRELRVITARPTLEEEALVPHKLYGVLPVSERCSAGIWLKLARMEIDWALGQNTQVIVVGGTGLYIYALLHGIAEIPDIPASVRQQAISDYEQMGKDAFAARLGDIDPEFITRLKVLDRQRLVRAYEVWLGSGKPLSWWQQQVVHPPYRAGRFTLFRVDITRELLYQRCNARFTQMIDQGAIDEVRSLLSLNLTPDLPALKSVGIKELSAYLRQEITLEEAIIQGQQATRNYAKRQLTWFRHQLPEAISVTDADAIVEYCQSAA